MTTFLFNEYELEIQISKERRFLMSLALNRTIRIEIKAHFADPSINRFVSTHSISKFY